MSKLILLNGFAGVGKSTIAKMYAIDEALTLSIEADKIMDMFGDWRNNQAEAVNLRLKHIVAMIRTHLATGHDVIIPYLVRDESEVKQADVIYIHGGSTNKLLTILRNYPDLRPLIEGKTVAGSSAGAYATAKYGASHSEKEMRAGLGLAPLRVVCHYESPELPPYKPSVENLKNTAQDLELVILKDYEWKVFRF